MIRDVAPELIETLRSMAREGKSASAMAKTVTRFIGDNWCILDVIKVFRLAFCLSLSEAAPLAGFSRPFGRNESECADDTRLDGIVTAHIKEHVREWDAAR
jgi:hypothetical protein